MNFNVKDKLFRIIGSATGIAPIIALIVSPYEKTYLNVWSLYLILFSFLGGFIATLFVIGMFVDALYQSKKIHHYIKFLVCTIYLLLAGILSYGLSVIIIIFSTSYPFF